MEDTEDYIKSHLHKERGTVEADRVALRGEVQRIQEQTAAQLQEVEQKLQDSLDKRMDLLEKEVGNHMGQLQVCFFDNAHTGKVSVFIFIKLDTSLTSSVD